MTILLEHVRTRQLSEQGGQFGASSNGFGTSPIELTKLTQKPSKIVKLSDLKLPFGNSPTGSAIGPHDRRFG